MPLPIECKCHSTVDTSSDHRYLPVEMKSSIFLVYYFCLLHFDLITEQIPAMLVPLLQISESVTAAFPKTLWHSELLITEVVTLRKYWLRNSAIKNGSKLSNLYVNAMAQVFTIRSRCGSPSSQENGVSDLIRIIC